MQENFIRNLETGQEIRFLSGSEDRLLMEMAFNGVGDPPPLHFHPHQKERFIVLSGHLVVGFPGYTSKYRAGDSIDIPVNTVHAMWNGHDGRTVVSWEVFPAKRTAAFFQELFEVINDRHRRKLRGLAPVQKIVLAHKYAPEFRLEKPPFWVIRLIYLMIWPLTIGRWRGSGPA